MAMKRLARHDLYQLGEPAGTISRIECFFATRRDTRLPVMIYRVPIQDPRRDCEEFISTVRPWGLLSNPRLPLLFDAWDGENCIEFATTTREGAPLDTDEAQRLLEQHHGNAGLSLCLQSLFALAALHEQNIAHRDVRAGRFVVCPDGTVFMRDSGLLPTIARQVLGEGEAGGFGLALSSNLQCEDLGDWALTCCRILGAGHLINDSHHDGRTLHGDLVDQIIGQVAPRISNGRLRKIVRRALMGRVPEAGDLESAAAARDALVKDVPELAISI
ncbi:MAG: hypothetical protein RLY93_00660 [Sumerlaeia bacterium]